MKLNDFIKRVPAYYAARKSVYLKSAPGRGKTETLTKSADILSKALNKNMGIVTISGPLLTPADSVGYLVPHKETDPVTGKVHVESRYTDPFWFRTKEGKRLDEFDGGIIVVDEADKMDVDVKKVIGEAALSGRLGPHTLPDGWLVWMAGNRSEDRSGSTKELDHLINRRMEIDIEDDVEGWLNWASNNGVTPVTMAFAANNPQVVFSGKVPEKQGPWCTPRSLVAADDYMKVLRDEEGNMPDDELTMEDVAGAIGQAAVAQYFAFVKLEREMPKFEDIVADPTGVKVPSKPDACMLVAFNLAHRVDMTTVDSVVEYASRMPQEFGVIFGKTAVGRNKSLVLSEGMKKWISKNASLMSQIGVHG